LGGGGKGAPRGDINNKKGRRNEKKIHRLKKDPNDRNKEPYRGEETAGEDIIGDLKSGEMVTIEKGVAR